LGVPRSKEIGFLVFEYHERLLLLHHNMMPSANEQQSRYAESDRDDGSTRKNGLLTALTTR
jgi:hypothetical protein